MRKSPSKEIPPPLIAINKNLTHSLNYAKGSSY